MDIIDFLDLLLKSICWVLLFISLAQNIKVAIKRKAYTFFAYNMAIFVGLLYIALTLYLIIHYL